MFSKELCRQCELGPCPVKAKKCEGDEQVAALVSATEMEGARTNPDGTINARQTACPTLNYDEDMPLDKHALKAQNEQRRATAQSLGLNANASQKEIDEAIAKKYGLK